MASPVLVYFEGRGRAEIIRLTLTALGIKFQEEALTSREQFLKLIEDGELLFQQVPLLTINGQRLVQTNAIVRHLARNFPGLQADAQPQDQTRIDMLFEGTRDFMQKFYGIRMFPEDQVIKEYREVLLPKYMPIFDKVVKETGSGYLVGASLSIADLGLLEVLLPVEEYIGVDAISLFPNVKRFYETVKALPNIQTYLKEVRKRKNDDAYVQQVMTILGRI